MDFKVGDLVSMKGGEYRMVVVKVKLGPKGPEIRTVRQNADKQIFEDWFPSCLYLNLGDWGTTSYGD